MALAMDAYGVSQYFDFMIASEEIGVEKPHRDVSKIIIRKTGEPAENIAYIGDNPLRDSFSKEAGMKFILYMPPSGYRKSVPWRDYGAKGKHEPDAVINRLRDLLEIIV